MSCFLIQRHRHAVIHRAHGLPGGQRNVIGDEPHRPITIRRHHAAGMPAASRDVSVRRRLAGHERQIILTRNRIDDRIDARIR